MTRVSDPNQKGNVAVVTALSIAVGVGVLGGSLATVESQRQYSGMQHALDTAVLSATMLPFETATEDRIAHAHFVFDKHYSGSGSMLSDPHKEFSTDLSNQPMFTVTGAGVDGLAQASVSNALMNLLGLKPIRPSVEARGQRLKSEPICLLALETHEPNGIEVYGNAVLAAENCAVMANSRNQGGLRTYGQRSGLSASSFGVTGGYTGTNYSPNPNAGVPPVEDPFTNIPLPSVQACTSENEKLTRSSAILNPGTYCGGLSIGANSDVVLNPGNYIILDGQFEVGSNSNLRGDNVTIFLIGSDAHISLKAGAQVKLTSPTSGPYANIQFMSDGDLTASKFRQEWSTILSGASLDYTGLMYLPEQEFWISGTAHEAIVQGNSPGYVAVVKKAWVQGNARLELRLADREGAENTLGDGRFEFGARLAR